MEKRRKLQAVFFDFDGVIVDSCAVKKDAFRKLFVDYPQEIIDCLLEYHRLHGGISRVEKIRWVHAELLNKPLKEEELARWAAHYSWLVTDAVVAVPYLPGVLDFLSLCREKEKHLPLFIVSGTPQTELQEIVRRRELDHCFTEVLGSPVLKPQHIRNMLSSYGLAPECCVFIGDALTDYDAAMETGLGFIGIKGDIDFPEHIDLLLDCRDLWQALCRRWRI